METSNSNPTELTEEQKVLIANRCKQPGKPPTYKELCELVWGPHIDGRNKAAKMIKEYVASMGYKARSTFDYHPVREDITLGQEHKDFIKAHPEMSALQIAKTLWANDKLCNFDKEVIAVRRFLQELAPTGIIPDEVVETSEYNPPKTLEQACVRVNRYIKEGIKKEQLDKDTRVQKNLECLIKYCHNPRFLGLMMGFVNKTDRMLFESSYVRYLYNVGEDISEVDLDGYISLCLEIVNRTTLQKELEKLTQERDQALDEGGKVFMPVVEMIGKIHQAIDNNEKRQGILRNALEGNRSKRLELQLQEHQSVLQLVSAWREERTRQRLLKLAEARKQVLRDEINRMETMDGVLGEIFGLDKEAFI